MRGLFRTIAWVLFAVNLGVIGFLLWRGGDKTPTDSGGVETSTEALPVYGALDGFTLTERSGAAFGTADLAGKVWVADFIFTHCAGMCPRMSTRMQELQAALADLPDARLVTITVDPERDTPERLRQYATEYGADASRWLFLTGEKSVIHPLCLLQFKLAVADNPEGKTMPGQEEIIHSQKLVLIDAQGRIRGYYDGLDDDAVVAKLRAHVEKLLLEDES